MNIARHIILFWYLSNTLVVADGWPMFRGTPSLAGGASTSLPQKPTLLWKFKTSAPIKSSAIIADGKVFFGSNDTNVYALDFRTGKKLWAYKTAGSVEAPGLFAAGKLFIGSTDGNLYSLDGNSGKLLWKYQTEAKIIGAPNIVVGTSSTSSQTNSLKILIGSYDFRLHCVDATTGKSNWVYETGNYINGSPAIADGKTVFGGCDGLLHVISVADGKQIKEIEAGAYVAASVALADNRAYFGHYENEFLCIDLNEGKTLWHYKNREFPYMSSAAVTKDKVLFGGRDKLLHCINRENGQKIWTFATQGKVDSSPVVAGDKVVVGSDDGRVYLVSLQTGKELWSYEIGQPIDSSPAVADGKIVIGSQDGYVYCFGEKKTNLSEKLGQKIVFEGTAINAKMGAGIIAHDLTIWIDGKDSWPNDLLSKELRIEGTLIERNDLPVFISAPGEPLKTGIPVATGTDLKRASHRFLLSNAVWKLKEK